jgi:hypothetical protein
MLLRDCLLEYVIERQKDRRGGKTRKKTLAATG